MQRGQVGQTAKAEHPQKGIRHPERHRLAGQIQAASFLNQSAFHQLGHGGRGIYAAHLLDEAAADRLVIGDNSQNFQRSGRKRRVAAGIQNALDHLAIIRAGRHLPAVAVKMQQHQAAFGFIIALLQLFQQGQHLCRVGAHGFGQAVGFHRFGVGKQHGF